MEHDETCRILERETLEQHALHDAEHRRVGPDAQGQDRDGGEGEQRPAPEGAEGKGEVLPDRVEGVALSHGGHSIVIDGYTVLLMRGEVAEEACRLGAGLGLGPSGRDELRGAKVQVQCDFLVDETSD